MSIDGFRGFLMRTVNHMAYCLWAYYLDIIMTVRESLRIAPDLLNPTLKGTGSGGLNPMRPTIIVSVDDVVIRIVNR